MKNNLIIVFFLIICMASKAQLEKGTMVPGFIVNLSLQTQPTKNDYYTSSNKRINSANSINAGKFIKDNLMVNLMAGYNLSKSITESTQKNTPSDHSKVLESNNLSQTESLGFGIHKFKFIKENFAFSYGTSIIASYSENTTKTNRLQTQFDGSTQKDIYYYSKSSNYSNSINLNLGCNLGISYFLNKNFAISGNVSLANVGFTKALYKQANNLDSYVLNFTLSPSFNNFGIGLSYYIHPKSK